MTVTTTPVGASARDYTSVTEVTGEAVRREAIAKMRSRYAFAAERAAGKDVLEIACGSAQGLGLVARRARRVVGGDCTFGLVRDAARHYGRRIDLLCLDAQALPFRDHAFDLALCYEALYYFRDVDRFAGEAARILRPGGELLVVSVNPRWPGFNRSPHSTHYHSATELRDLLARHGFTADVYGAFVESGASLPSRVVGLIRRIAVALHLVPKTMRGKRLLKRLFYGRLVALPPELDEVGAALPELQRLATDSAAYTVLYAIGRTPAAP